MKKLMVIAGGDWQIELVKKIKAMGHHVLCSNLYEDSPAFKYSDECAVANVLDKEKNLQIAKEYKPDAVISDQSDISVPTVAYLNETLGLRGIGVEKANIFTDKYLMRQTCKENGIPVPDFKLCNNVEDAREMLQKYGKIVIKPIDSQSSRGVFTIHTDEELDIHFEESISFSNRRKEILAEEYIGGPEFTIDGVVVNGNHYPLCISIKEMYEANPNISRMQTYTHYHEKYDYEKLREENKRLIETVGLPFGLTHSEYKYDKGQFYLIEAGARGGGSNLSAKIVPFISNVDNYEILIKGALGEDIDEDKVRNVAVNKERCVVMRFFDFGEGIVKKVYGLEELETNKYMIDYQLEVKPGDTLYNPKYGRLRPGHFIIGAESHEEAFREMERILEKVYVEFEDN